MSFEIYPIKGGDPRIRPLLEAHAAFCSAVSSPGSCHFLAPDALVGPDLLVWAALKGEIWITPEEEPALGVGALRLELEKGYGEVKSMHTSEAARGQGVAAAILQEIIENARALELERLLLETGTAPAFAPARDLYKRFGFVEREPFGEYQLNPESVYMECHL
jgi:putative acetyltransferase